jgi:hypothetical protein
VLVQVVVQILSGFAQAIPELSATSHPTLNEAVPVYNCLFDALEGFLGRCDDAKGWERAAIIDACSPANQTILKRALKAAHAKLHSYYCDTWPGVYAVALILDPRLRISYLENIGWEAAWVQEGNAAVLEAMEEYETENPQSDESDDEAHSESLLMEAYKKARMGQAPQEECEFGRYVMSPPVRGRTKV